MEQKNKQRYLSPSLEIIRINAADALLQASGHNWSDIGND